MRDRNLALELVELGIDFCIHAKLKKKSVRINEDPFRWLLLYCLKEVRPGMWLPLNRDYNPIGLVKDKWCDYQSPLYESLLIKTDDINFDVLWDNGDGKDFYTFSDGTYPDLYSSCTKKMLKLHNRYVDIIKTAFLGQDTITFDEAWAYKEPYDSKGLKYNRDRLAIKYDKFLELELQKALNEIGNIQPWYDENVKSWVYSNVLYPTVEAGEDTAEETVNIYKLYLKEFLQHRICGNIPMKHEYDTAGNAGVIDDETFKSCLNASRKQFFQLMRNLSKR